MSDELIIINQERLFIDLGWRLTALPDTGTIASIAKTSPDASIVGGLHRTASLVINGSDIHTLTINVMPMSSDDERLQKARKAIRQLGRPLPAKVTYNGTEYISGGVGIQQDPQRDFLADGTAFLAYPLIGLFPIITVSRLRNPDPLTLDLIDATT